MRQPKFRGVSKETNKWIYGFGWFETDYTEIYLQELEQTNQDALFFTDFGYVHYHIDSMGQYTGVNDINNAEIFEGDIVKREFIAGFSINEDFIGEVKMLEGQWVIDNGQDAIPLWSEADELYILGNKFENPELLEGEAH